MSDTPKIICFYCGKDTYSVDFFDTTVTYLGTTDNEFHELTCRHCQMKQLVAEIVTRRYETGPSKEVLISGYGTTDRSEFEL